MWSNTDCRTVSDLLWNYMSRRLPLAEEECVEKHLGECGACRAEADAYRRTVDALGTMRRDPLPESRRGWRELESRLMAAPAHRPLLARIGWGLPQAAWGGAALAAVLCIAVLPQMKWPFRVDPQSIQSTARVRANGDENKIVRSSPEEQSDSTPDPMDLVMSEEEGSIRASSGQTMTARPRSTPRVRSLVRSNSSVYSSDRVRLTSLKSPRRRRTNLDYVHVDGNIRQPSSRDNSDYVLTSVSAQSDSDSGGQYVMGSLVMADRSEDTGVAQGW